MVTVLPSARTPFDVFGAETGRALQSVIPGAVQQGYQRQIGMNALEQAKGDIEAAGNDPYKIALAFAKVGAQAPGLERALGPLMQTAMTQANVRRAFPQAGQQGTVPSAIPADQQAAPPVTQPQEPISGTPQAKPSDFATPSPFNVMTKDQMDAEAQRYAISVNDPNGYNSRYNQLQAQNDTATAQRQALEDMAIKANVKPEDLPRFMIVGSKFDVRNPSEWMQNTKREFDKVRNNDRKIEKAFIPGVGSALFGKNREQALKNLVSTSQDQKARGLEQETRQYYADNYMTPTEIEEQFYPVTKEQESSIKKLPRGLFPLQKPPEGKELFFGKEKEPFVSYEEALERDPKSLERMQNQLADFFLQNVDKDTSLLALRRKLVEDRDYDWRQIGSAIRLAQKRGLKLEEHQQSEMADIDTQAPIQSLPDIFSDVSRILPFLGGAK